MQWLDLATFAYTSILAVNTAGLGICTVSLMMSQEGREKSSESGQSCEDTTSWPQETRFTVAIVVGGKIVLLAS